MALDIDEKCQINKYNLPPASERNTTIKLNKKQQKTGKPFFKDSQDSVTFGDSTS